MLGTQRPRNFLSSAADVPATTPELDAEAIALGEDEGLVGERDFSRGV